MAVCKFAFHFRSGCCATSMEILLFVSASVVHLSMARITIPKGIVG